MEHHLVDPPPSLFKLCPCGQKCPHIKLTFSEYGLVAYQIKLNAAYNSISASVLLLHLYLLLISGVGSKGLFVFFSESSHVT